MDFMLVTPIFAAAACKTAAPLFCAAADPPISAVTANTSQIRFAISSSRVDLLTLYGLGRGVRPCTRP